MGNYYKSSWTQDTWVGALTRAKCAQRSTMSEIIRLSMHPRNLSSILALSAPWDNQCEMTLFTLSGTW